MNKNKLITLVAIGLLISNLMLIGFIMFGKHRPPNWQGPKKIISEKLHFDAKQIEDYEKLISVHSMKIASQDSLIRQSKKELFDNLVTNNIEKKDSLLNKLGKLQMQIEDIHYQHFLDIKKICKENQLQYFDSLVGELTRLFAPPKVIQPRR